MSSMVVRCGVCAALAAASVMMTGALWAAGAGEMGEAAEAAEAESAAPSGGHEALQLSLMGSLLDYQKLTVTPAKLPDSSIEPEARESSSTSFGLLGSGFGVGVGYAWDQVLLGARLQLTSTTVNRAGGSEEKASTVGLLPRVEYMFNSGSARPFIAGLVGIEHSFSSTSVDAGPMTSPGRFEDSRTLFGIGAAFGIHTFLNQAASLDPELSVLYAAGSGSTKESGVEVTSPVQDYSASVLRVLVSLSLSGWIDTGGAPAALPSPAERAPVATPVAAAPAAIADAEPLPVSADIRLPNYRRLYIQVFKDPAQPAVLARLTEPRGSFELLKCDSVAIWENGAPIKLVIRSHGEHYLTGRLPIRALEVLVANPESTISVCSQRWQLGQESREAVQSFLNARRDLISDTDDSEVPPAAPPAPAPTPGSDTPAAAPASPSATPANPGATPANPGAAPANPNAPSGVFPAAPNAAPTAPAAVPPKTAPPKK